jgi:hypothetical protein
MLNAQGPQQMFYALNQNQYLLDMLPNANHSVAYSIRKLRAAYTGPAFKVRRSGGGGGSGSPEGDVYFDENGFVSTSSMITITKSGGGYSTTSKVVWSTFFASSSSNGFVVTWYDQSVNGNDATQLTNSAQPQVVSSGALITENGLPTLQFVGAHGSEYLGLNTAISLPNATLFGVCRVTSGSTTVGIAENGTYSYNLNTYSNTGFLGITHYTVADVPSTLSYSTSALNTYSWSKLSTNTFVEVNNRTAASTAARDIPIAISQVYGNALSGSTLRISEFIVTSYASTTVRSSVFESQRLVFKTL